MLLTPHLTLHHALYICCCNSQDSEHFTIQRPASFCLQRLSLTPREIVPLQVGAVRRILPRVEGRDKEWMFLQHPVLRWTRVIFFSQKASTEIECKSVITFPQPAAHLMHMFSPALLLHLYLLDHLPHKYLWPIPLQSLLWRVTNITSWHKKWALKVRIQNLSTCWADATQSTFMYTWQGLEGCNFMITKDFMSARPGELEK